MRIGTAPVNWNNADVDIRPWMEYRQMLDEMVAAGYDATEWGPGFPDDEVAVGKELRARNLSMIGMFVPLGFRDADRYDEEMAKAMAIARRLHHNGGTLIIAAEAGDDRRRAEAGHVVEANGLTDEQWRNLAKGLEDLADNVAHLGIKVVVHNHVGTYVETQNETIRLLEETNPAKVGWCFDVGHLAYGGGNNLEMLERYGDRVAHVHIKDVDGGVLARARAEDWSFADALRHYIFNGLGQGIARVPDMVEALLARGYDGYFVIEQDTQAGAAGPVAKENREILLGMLATAGAA
jgi:inosose dehydratase